jgi:hypothetical protein
VQQRLEPVREGVRRVHDVEELRATRKRQVVSSKVSSKKYLIKAPAASSDKIKREKLKKK